jgi:hypothetical protein
MKLMVAMPGRAQLKQNQETDADASGNHSGRAICMKECHKAGAKIIKVQDSKTTYRHSRENIACGFLIPSYITNFGTGQFEKTSRKGR